MLETIEQILMRRDGLDKQEAQDLIDEAKEEVQSIIENGGTLEEVEDVVRDYFGLEPDYVEEMLSI